MKTRLAPIAAALALAASGCADNMGTVQIFETCTVPDDCTFTGECSAAFIGEIVVDVGQQDHLTLFLQLNNQRTKTEGVDNADAYVQEFVTEYDVLAVPSPGTTGAFSAPGTSGHVANTVPSSGSSVLMFQAITPSVGAALVPQIPSSTPTAPKYVDLRARTRLKGTYTDQTSFETAAYEYPIRVCKGCLPVFCLSTEVPISCPPDSAGQTPGQTNGCLTP
jgi:hypothetical protein